MEKLYWGWCVTVERSCPQLLKGYLVVGNILITFVEELLDDLDLPLNGTMASWVVRTASSHGESPLVSEFLVLLQVNWVPLSQMISFRVPSTEKQKIGVEITSLKEMREIFCT